MSGRTIVLRDLIRPDMFRKLFLISLLIVSLIKSYGANRIELVIDEDLTLENIFAAGLRPSSTTPSNKSDIRVWERQAVTLLFDDFRYEIDTEQITFGVYNDDQISFMRLRTTSEKPLSVEEAVNEVELFSFGLGFDVAQQITQWREKCAKRNSMAMAGFGGFEWKEDVRILGEFMTTLQPLDKFPVVLAFEIRWKYRGKDTSIPTALRGKRRAPIVSPSGYSWDMSFEAWSKRTKNGQAGNRVTNIPPERSGITIPDNLPDPLASIQKNSDKNLPENTNERLEIGPRALSWLYWILGSLILGGVGILVWNSGKGSSAS